MKDKDHKSKTWGPLMATVTYEYNLAVHSATRKSPFELFMKRRGCNNVIDQTLDIEEASNTSEEESICTPDENEFSVDLKYLERMDRKCVHNSIHDFVIIKKTLTITLRTDG
jgi:UDP-glucose 6-dehydrogenase